MTWVAVGSAAVAVVGSYAASENAAGAAEDAAAAGERGAQLSTAEQRRQYDLTRQDQMPWLQAGQRALQLQDNFLRGDTSGFENSAGYKFAVDQGFQGLNRGAAANGSFNSGGADADRIAFGQGLASQYADNYWNKLSARAGIGQSTASGLGTLGANMAANVGNNYMNAANARASSYQQGAAAQNQAIGTATGAIVGGLNAWGSRPQQTTQQPFAWQPQQGGWQSGTGSLGPSNGSSWNFGGG